MPDDFTPEQKFEAAIELVITYGIDCGFHPSEIGKKVKQVADEKQYR